MSRIVSATGEVSAIVTELDRGRSPLHIAIENWQHDLNNIGSIVRTANAFNVAGMHIVGNRDWNRRGAMVTDRYLHVQHHPDVAAFGLWAAAEHLPIIGIDNIPAASRWNTTGCPQRRSCSSVRRGPVSLQDAVDISAPRCSRSPSTGSTRSMNASAAGASPCTPGPCSTGP